MDDEGDPQVTIQTKFVTDTSGADQALDAVDQIEGATKKATESSHSLMGEQLGSLRTAHHLFEGVREIAEGGTMELAGLSTEARVAAEVFETMLGPAAPFVIILSTLLAVGIPSLSKAFGDVGDKAKKAKDETGELKDNMEALDASTTSFAGSAAKAVTDIAEAEKQQQAAIRLADQQNKEELDHAQKMLDLQHQLTNAIIDRARASELASNTGGAGGALAINEKYDSIKMAADTNFKFVSLNAKIDQSLQHLQALGDQYKSTQDNRDSMQQQHDELTDAAQTARDRASQTGVQPDPKGSYDSVISDLKKQLNSLGDEWKKNQYMIQHETLPGEPDKPNPLYVDKGKQIDDETHRVMAQIVAAVDVKRADAALKDAGPKAATDIDTANKTLADIALKEDATKDSYMELLEQLKLLRVTTDNDKTQQGLKNHQAEQGLADRSSEAENKAQVDGFEETIADKALPASKRADAAKQIGALQAAALLRKLEEGTAVGAEKPLTTGEADELKAQAAKVMQGGIDRAQSITTEESNKNAEAAHRATETRDKEDTATIKQLHSQIDQTGNRQLMEDTRRLLTGVLDKTQQIAAMQAELASVAGQKFSQVDRAMDRSAAETESLRRQIKSSGNGNNH